MAKCPQCGVSVEDSVKFCMECGVPIPQTKECPLCHARWPLTAKFCSECGYNFNAAKTSGSVIGDKNVIAGDVHIDQSSTVNNNTVNNITSTTNNTTIINQDETRKLVACCVCGRQMAVVDAFVCSQCHQHVCRDHYNAEVKLCSSCAEGVARSSESMFRDAAKKFIDSGIVGVEEAKSLAKIGVQLGIADFRQKEIIDDIHYSKGNLIAIKVELTGSTMRIGREPFKRKEDLDYADHAKLRDPAECLDNLYVFNCYETSIIARVTWRSIDDELNRIEASLDGSSEENGGGPV